MAAAPCPQIPNPPFTAVDQLCQDLLASSDLACSQPTHAGHFDLGSVKAVLTPLVWELGRQTRGPEFTAHTQNHVAEVTQLVESFVLSSSRLGVGPHNM
jgi:hypothetical protein